ncbi:hypothetical protein BO71DRAFT_396104 [Aspergillus ellipticus CBS 707.79]|uniref:Uncharacterized protein n=1 Tax=Aspergillus ellipticus CBS 707.79 TaxID=1448320 RepID=A0A319EZM3_9EURO|nr:hypothetical protein BO71DRAFT_396104 [Aspergillus ellipticus CBS 707.79]
MDRDAPAWWQQLLLHDDDDDDDDDDDPASHSRPHTILADWHRWTIDQIPGNRAGWANDNETARPCQNLPSETLGSIAVGGWRHRRPNWPTTGRSPRLAQLSKEMFHAPTLTMQMMAI